MFGRDTLNLENNNLEQCVLLEKCIWQTLIKWHLMNNLNNPFRIRVSVMQSNSQHALSMKLKNSLSEWKIIFFRLIQKLAPEDKFWLGEDPDSTFCEKKLKNIFVFCFLFFVSIKSEFRTFLQKLTKSRFFSIKGQLVPIFHRFSGAGKKVRTWKVLNWQQALKLPSNER